MKIYKNILSNNFISMNILQQYPRDTNQYTSNIIFDNNQTTNDRTLNLYNQAMQQNTNIVTPIRNISEKKLSKTIIEPMNNIKNNSKNYNNNNDYDSTFSDDYSINDSNINTKFINTQEKFIDDIASNYGSPINDNVSEKSLDGFAGGQYNQLRLNYTGIPSTMQGNQNSNSYNITNNTKIDSSNFSKDNDGRYNAINEMTHNNMVPSFKSKSYGFNPLDDKKRNGLWNDRMELFTGSDQMAGYAHKTEITPMFKQEATKVESVTGMPNFSDYMQSRVIPSQTQNGVRPFQPIMQTPGLNLGYNQNGNTGLQDFYRALPRSIDELRTADNPQTSYTLPVSESGMRGNKGAVIGQFHKQKPDRFYENSLESMMQTDAPMTGPKLNGKIDIPMTNRGIASEKTQMNGAKYQTADKTYQHGEFNAPFKKSNIETGPRNVTYDTKGQIINQGTYRASDTNRSTTSNTQYLNNINGNKQEQQLVNYLNMIPDANPNKEQTQLIANTQGNYKSMPLVNFSSIIPDANNRNSTNINQVGNASNHLKSYIYNYINSIPDETLRSILSEKIIIKSAKGNMEQNYLFNAKNATQDANMRNLTEDVVYVKPISNKEQSYIFNYANNVPDTTLRELINTAWNGMLIQGNFQQAALFNYEDAKPETTLKEMIEQTKQLQNINGNKQNSTLFNYINNIPNVTIKETTENTKYSANTTGNNQQSQFFNYKNNIPNATIKETTENTKYSANTTGNNQQSQFFNYKNNVPNATIKETTENTKYLANTTGNNQQSQFFNYKNNIPNATIKEMTETTKHLTGTKGNNLQSQLYNYDDKTKTTMRELTEDNNGVTNVNSQILNKGQLFNYENNIAEQTNRSMTENTKNISGMKGNYTQERSRQDVNNMLVNTQKEIIAKGRKPTMCKGNVGQTTLFTNYTFNNDNNSINSVFSGVRTKPINYF